jgi:lysophosphatidate acyltransferase
MLVALREISSSDAPSIDTPSRRAEVRAERTPTPSQSSIDTKPEIEAERSSPTPEGSVASSRHEGSENGVETEEDEGMVLVGRP